MGSLGIRGVFDRGVVKIFKPRYRHPNPDAILSFNDIYSLYIGIVLFVFKKKVNGFNDLREILEFCDYPSQEKLAINIGE
jgi:hypothetical protein